MLLARTKKEASFKLRMMYTSKMGRSRQLIVVEGSAQLQRSKERRV
jgi:hypothetical protein